MSKKLANELLAYMLDNRLFVCQYAGQTISRSYCEYILDEE
jgi:hypothetical protein